MKGARSVSPFGVRLPSELKEWIKQSSEIKSVSMNSELIRIVREAKKTEEKQAA